MKIKFRDVQHGRVQARAVIEIAEGIFINEITILEKNDQLIVELPKKSFKGKDNKMHYIDIITFENENKRTLWLYEIKEEYLKWRKTFKTIEIYESSKD